MVPPNALSLSYAYICIYQTYIHISHLVRPRRPVGVQRDDVQIPGLGRSHRGDGEEKAQLPASPIATPAIPVPIPVAGGGGRVPAPGAVGAGGHGGREEAICGLRLLQHGLQRRLRILLRGRNRRWRLLWLLLRRQWRLHRLLLMLPLLPPLVLVRHRLGSPTAHRPPAPSREGRGAHRPPTAPTFPTPRPTRCCPSGGGFLRLSLHLAVGPAPAPVPSRPGCATTPAVEDGRPPERGPRARWPPRGQGLLLAAERPEEGGGGRWWGNIHALVLLQH